MTTDDYIRRIQEVFALLGIVACFYLLLVYGIPLAMEEQDIRNQIRWEAQR